MEIRTKIQTVPAPAQALGHRLLRTVVQKVKSLRPQRLVLDEHGQHDEQHQAQRQHAGHIEPRGRCTDGRVNRVRQRGIGVDRGDRGGQTVVAHRIHKDEHGRRAQGGQHQRKLDVPPYLKAGGAVHPCRMHETDRLPFQGGPDGDIGHGPLAQGHDGHKAGIGEHKSAHPVKAQPGFCHAVSGGEIDPALSQDKTRYDHQDPGGKIQHLCALEPILYPDPRQESGNDQSADRGASRQSQRVEESFSPEGPGKDVPKDRYIFQGEFADLQTGADDLKKYCCQRQQY